MEQQSTSIQWLSSSSWLVWLKWSSNDTATKSIKQTNPSAWLTDQHTPSSFLMVFLSWFLHAMSGKQNKQLSCQITVCTCQGQLGNHNCQALLMDEKSGETEWLSDNQTNMSYNHIWFQSDQLTVLSDNKNELGFSMSLWFFEVINGHSK